MDYLLENYEYLVLFIIAVLLILGFYNASILKRITNYFSSQRFRITSLYEIEAVDLSENFSITIFNNNINDSRVVALGFLYKNKNIDYYNFYLKINELGTEAKVIIPSRDSINLKVSCEEISGIIRDLNNGTAAMKQISVFAIDSLGITTYVKSSQVRKNIKKIIKSKFKVEHELKKIEQKNLRRDQKLQRIENRAIKHSVRKQKFNDFRMRIKIKFKK